jgi:hypothetical protein
MNVISSGRLASVEMEPIWFEESRANGVLPVTIGYFSSGAPK